MAVAAVAEPAQLLERCTAPCCLSLRCLEVPHLHVNLGVGLPALCSLLGAVGLPNSTLEPLRRSVSPWPLICDIPQILGLDSSRSSSSLLVTSLQQWWSDVFIHVRTCLGFFLCVCCETVVKALSHWTRSRRTRRGQKPIVKEGPGPVIAAHETAGPGTRKLRLSKPRGPLPRVCRVRRCRFLGSSCPRGRGSGRRAKRARLRYRRKVRALCYKRLYYWTQGRLPFPRLAPVEVSEEQPTEATAVMASACSASAVNSSVTWWGWALARLCSWSCLLAVATLVLNWASSASWNCLLGTRL